MNTPPPVALGLLVLAAPVCLWVAYTDMSRLKIPNRAVLCLAAAYALGGLLLLPLPGWGLSDYAWRWTHLPLVLVLGIALNAAGLVGAGDAKFAAAAAPFVAAADAARLLWIMAAMLLAAVATHRLALRTLGPRLAPGWASWTSGKRFPMGLALGGALVAYLLLAALA